MRIGFRNQWKYLHKEGISGLSVLNFRISREENSLDIEWWIYLAILCLEVNIGFGVVK